MLWFSALVFALGVILNLNIKAPPQPQVLAEHTQFPKLPPCVSPLDLDVLVDKFNALPQDFTPPDLIPVGKFLLRGEAAGQLKAMFEEMQVLSFRPSINSAYRTYDDQDVINNVSDNMKSAQPGHSEHQLGTAVDLHLTNAAWNWLDQNAHRYGFVMSYRANQVILTGYKYEPWHWRYVGADLAPQIRESTNTPQSFYRQITCN